MSSGVNSRIGSLMTLKFNSPSNLSFKILLTSFSQIVGFNKAARSSSNNKFTSFSLTKRSDDC